MNKLFTSSSSDSNANVRDDANDGITEISACDLALVGGGEIVVNFDGPPPGP